MTGKDEAVLFPSGTAAILAYCNPGERVLVDEIQHIYRNEKVVFDKSVGQLISVLNTLNERNTTDIDTLRT